jgi:hypothetical protein
MKVQVLDGKIVIAESETDIVKAIATAAATPAWKQMSVKEKWDEAKPTFTKDDLKQYPTYKDIIEKFRSHYGLTAVSFRHVDKFLWRYKGG